MYYHQYLLHSTSNKSEEGGINLIQNPSFENGLDYWYNKYGLDDTFWTQTNDDCSKVGVNKTGEYYGEQWNAPYLKQSTLSQDICGLPDGLYKLTVNAAAVYDWLPDGITGVNLVCGYNSTPINLGKTYELYAVVANGYLNVGIEIDPTNNSDWVVCDDWSLTKVKNGRFEVYNDYLTKIAHQGKLLYTTIDYNNLGYIDEFSINLYNNAVSITDSAGTIYDIIEAVRYWEQYIAYSSNILPTRPSSNISITFTNPSFENNFDGWINNGLEIQTNDSPSRAGWDKDGTKYAQVWNQVACPNSTLTHAINTNYNGMSGGYYEFEVKGHALYEWSADNITGAYLFTSFFDVNNETPMTVGKTYKTHVIIGSNSPKYIINNYSFWHFIEVGVKNTNTNANWTAIDDVKIYKRDADISVYKAYFDKLKAEIDELTKVDSSGAMSTIYSMYQNYFDKIKDDLNKHNWEYSKLTLSIMIYKMENLLGHVHSIPHSGGSAN